MDIAAFGALNALKSGKVLIPSFWCMFSDLV